MAIEKPLMVNIPDEIVPQDDEEDIEVVVDDPMADEYDLDEYEEIVEEVPLEHDSNLAEAIMDMEDGEDILVDLANDLIDLYEADKESISEWQEIAADAIDLLGFKQEESDTPFPGAATAHHPLLAQAVIKFQAKAFKELFPPGGPVKTKIVGPTTKEKQDAAQRVRDFMNYQTTMQMPEYGPQLDRLLFHTALYGSSLKKTYFDPSCRRPVSKFVKSSDFIIDYYAEDLQSAQRYTHVMRLSDNEIKRYQIAGIYRRDLEVSESAEPNYSAEEEGIDETLGRSRPRMVDDIHTILEMHVELDLPGFEHPDGLRLPYVVTIDEDTKQVYAIRRNWREDDPTFKKRVWFTHYCFIPGLGFFGYGYLHLIGGLSKTATSSMRQLIDAGMFATLPAGFKSSGLRILMPDEPLQPGEWRDVQSAINIKDALSPLPYKEPSQTLLSLLQFVVDAAKEFADTTDQVVNDSTNYGPVGTTLALLEQSAKLYSAIHARLHAAQAHDLRLLAEINYENPPDDYPYEVVGQAEGLLKADFDLRTIDVFPVSDPNMPTEAHRVAKLNAIMGVAAQDPSAHNMREIRMDLYRAMGVEQPEKYMAQTQEPFSGDPVSENMAAVIGTPLKIEPYQNDDSHIKSHAMLVKNPAYAGNQQMQIILTSHINQHLAQKYRKDMVAQIQDPQLQQAIMQGGKLPPELENAIAQQVALASDAVLEIDTMKDQILADAQGGNDPLIEMQREELRLRELKENHDYDVAMKKLALQEAETMIKDVNTDLDREAKIKIAKMQNRGDK